MQTLVRLYHWFRNPGPYDQRVRRDVWALAILAFLLFGAGLGLRDPWPPDEPRFVMMAMHMVDSGQWLVPMRLGEIYADKPPFFMWTQAVVYAITGSMRLALLLPSLIAGIVSTLLVYDLGRRLWTRKVGIAAGLVLLATYQFTLQARFGQIDAFLCMFTTLGVYGLMRHLLRGPHWPWCWAGFAAMGLGIISKGVGFLPVLLLIPYSYAVLRHWPGLSPLGDPKLNGGRWAVGVGALLGAVGLWLIPMLIIVATSHDPTLEAYRNEILFKQTAQRYADSWHHLRAPWYMVQRALTYWLPLTLFLPWLIPAWWRRLRRRDPRYLLLLGWILLLIVFFSIPTGKRGVYLLPATPALALAIAPLLPGLMRLRRPQNVARWLVYGLSALVLGAAVTAGWINTELGIRLMSDQPFNPWLGLCVAAVVSAAIVYRAGRRRAFQALGLVIAFNWLLYGWWALPALDKMKSGRGLMAEVAERIGPAGEIGMPKHRDNFSLLGDRKVMSFSGESFPAALGWLKAGDDRWLLIREDQIPACWLLAEKQALRPLYEYRWVLVRRVVAPPDCASDPL